MKGQFNILTQLQGTLKQYEEAVKEAFDQVTAISTGLPPEEAEYFLNLQKRLKEAGAKSNTDEVLAIKQEFMNYLKDRNATDNSGNKS